MAGLLAAFVNGELRTAPADHWDDYGLCPRADAIAVPAGYPVDLGWDAATLAFVPVADLPRPRVMSAFDYFLLFTPAEILGYAESADPMMRYAYEVAKMAPSINLDDSRVVAGRLLGVQQGVLTPARAARIAAGLPPEGP